MNTSERRIQKVFVTPSIDLVCEIVDATGPPKAVVVLGHAMFCNRRTLDRPRGEGLASTLAALGLEVWMADLRGHGDSPPAPTAGSSTSYDDYVFGDIPMLIRTAKAAHPELPLVLVGHSLTGHAGIAALAVDPELPVDAVVSLAGNVWIRDLEPSLPRWMLKYLIMNLFSLTAKVTGHYPARRLGMGTDDEAAPYVQQLATFARSNVWGSRCGYQNYLSGMEKIRIPILSVVGQADTWMCQPKWAERWLAHATNAELHFRVVGELDSDPQDIDHMKLVTDLRMKPIWTEMGHWILNQLSKG
ncbi:MAG TPA: alpha/beta fold hydrolase [Myxococcales bacterium]|nr:alpha/beta fold hydrolase [Myxococcales bacterium]